MDSCVLFAIPCYDQRVAYEFLQSMIATEHLLTSQKISHGYVGQSGDQFIARVRNKLVTQFLRDYPEATDLFFLDDDVGWPAEKVVEFLDRPEDIVAGIYPKKQDKLDFPVELAIDPATGGTIERNGLVKAQHAPTGFMRIKRHVIQSIASNAGEFHELGETKTYYDVFRTGVVKDVFCGEDFIFCLNARLAGFEIWVDPNIDFTHRGQKLWSNNLSHHMGVYRKRAKTIASGGQPVKRP